MKEEPNIDDIPTAYDPFLCEIVEMMMDADATLDDVAKVLRVDQQTLESWRKQHPEFNKTINDGLDWRDTQEKYGIVES